MLEKILKLPVPAPRDADDHAQADTQRNQRLFDWADAVLRKLGLDKAIAARGRSRSCATLRSMMLRIPPS